MSRPIFMFNTEDDIAIDMDGVAVDLDAHFKSLFGTSLWTMDKDEKSRHWEELFDPKWFLEAPMMSDFPVLIDFILSNFKRVRFLTALPNRRKDMAWQSMEAKLAWVHTYVGHHIPVTFGPYAADKHKHCGGRSFVLIDDSLSNVEQWIDAGGYGVLHERASDTISVLETRLLPIGEFKPFKKL